MTPQQAKQLLLAFRPWAKDVHEPEVVAALAVCRQDAELARWFENHCAVQNAIHARFNQMPVPAGLKEQILSEYKSRAVITWWRQPTLLAAAAALAILIAVGSLWLTIPRPGSEEVSFASYRSRMGRTALRTYGMDLETSDGPQIRTYLAQHQAPADYVLPRNLETSPPVGCGVLKWQDQPVAMVCFRTGKPLAPGAKSDLFLFVIDRKSLPDLRLTNTPEFAPVNKLVTASWLAGEKVYILAGFDEESLRRRL
ncbi:MAG: hypothetical protein V9H26_18990 [Verrucomicrobiota bacterium]